MVDRVVVDASALLPLVLPDTSARVGYAVDLVSQVAAGAVRLVMPQLCHVELAAAVARRVRGRDLDDARARRFFAEVEALGFEPFAEGLHFTRCYAQAMTLGCQVADGVYLAVAMQLEIPIATLDRGMRQAATQAGVAIHEPG